ALECLDLAPLDIREPDLDARESVGLFALDLLEQRALPSAQPLPELVERAPPLLRVVLDLDRRRRERVPRRPLDLLAQPRDRGALVVAFGRDAIRVDRDPCLGLGNQLLLALADARDLAVQPGERAVEVLLPLTEPLVDLLLGLGERRDELDGARVLALGDELAVVLRDPPLLLLQERHPVGARP